LNIIVVALLSDKKLLSKIAPIAELEKVETIYLVRRYPIKYKKVSSYNPAKILNKNIVVAELTRILFVLYLCIFKKPDAIMGIYLVWHGVYAYIFGKIFRIPIINVLISGHELKLCEQYNLLRLIMLDSNFYITRGDNTKNELVSKGVPEDNVFSIPNAYTFSNDNSTSGNIKKEYDLIYIGYFDGYKRIDILFKSVKRCIDDYGMKDIKLALVGDGALKVKLRDLAKTEGISRNIIFCGWQRDVYEFINKSKVFIMTSEGDGLPMAMIESLSCGLPCIMPDFADINTVAVHNYNSLLVKVGDIEEFSKCIHRLLSDDVLYARLSENAANIKSEKKDEYSMQNIQTLWSGVLSKI